MVELQQLVTVKGREGRPPTSPLNMGAAPASKGAEKRGCGGLQADGRGWEVRVGHGTELLSNGSVVERFRHGCKELHIHLAFVSLPGRGRKAPHSGLSADANFLVLSTCQRCRE